MSKASFFLLHEDASLPSEEGTDSEKYTSLTEVVRSEGVFRQTLDLPRKELGAVLERIDRYIGGTGFLPVLLFNNSPNNLLGDDGDCPPFGYFSPPQARDLYSTLADIQEPEKRRIFRRESSQFGYIFNILRSLFGEATKRGAGVAILHE